MEILSLSASERYWHLGQLYNKYVSGPSTTGMVDAAVSSSPMFWVSPGMPSWKKSCCPQHRRVPSTSERAQVWNAPPRVLKRVVGSGRASRV